MKHNKKGFSFVELMMVLIFFFIILASLMPMITRRHLAPPQKVNHGTYACYWDGDELKETLIKGKKTIIDNEPVVGSACHFDVPTKARYFYVQLIGGGGGGQNLTNEDDLIKDEYQVKGLYKKTGSDFVWPSGSCTGKTLDCTDWTDILNDEEFNALVGSRRLVLQGSSGSGEICDPNLNPIYYGERACGPGVIDSAPYCSISESKFPSSCESSLPAGYKLSASMYQLDCTPSTTEPKDCESCPTITCENVVAKTTENPTGKADYEFKTTNTTLSTRCENNKAGSGASCHRFVPMAEVGRNIIHANHWYSDATECHYIRGTGPTRLSDGAGLIFTKGSEVYLKICGGEGAQTGKNRFENPNATMYYHVSPPKVEYCSLPSEYNESADGRCLDIPGYSHGGSPSEYGGAGPAPSTLNPDDYVYPGVGIYDIKVSQTQVIPYGVGGRAGEVKTLILKSIPDNIPIEPGKGGGIGLPGQETAIGPATNFPRKVAAGGDAGTSIFTIDANLSPYIDDDKNLQGHEGNWRTTTTVNMDSRQGGKVSFSSFVKFIISYNNKDMQNRLAVFGSGGYGAATETLATCSYLYEPVTLEDSTSILNQHLSVTDHANIPVPTWTYDNDGITAAKCNGYGWETINDNTDNDYTTGYDLGHYTNGTDDNALHVVESATAGSSGAVVISW